MFLKKFITGVLTIATLLLPSFANADVYVKGYTKSNGTYVAPHYRSDPDGNFNNNWSTKGNINPYTGLEGTKTSPSPSYGGTYNYGGTTNYNTYTPPPNPTIVSCPINSYRSALDSKCYCNSGYEPSLIGTGCSLKPYIPPPESSCPINSTESADGTCRCNTGYQTDSTKTYCVQKTCPFNAQLIGNICLCNYGYVVSGSSCISHTDDCKITYGPDVIGKPGTTGDSSCYCTTGYEWNTSRTSCVKKLTCPANALPWNGVCKCIAMYQPTSDGNGCEPIPNTPLLQIPTVVQKIDITPDTSLSAKYIQAKQNVYARNKPAANGGIIGTIKKSETFEILEQRNGWYKIQMKSGKLGWSMGKYYSTVE